MRLVLTRVCSAVLLVSYLAFFSAVSNAAQSSQAELETKLSLQYGAIQRQFRAQLRPTSDAVAARLARRAWQDELARLFTEAATTIEEILRLNPPNSDLWRERLETLRLYAQPITPPSKRTVYGPTEVDEKARLITKPYAVYTTEARAAKAKDEVRIRLVLAADGTIKNIFPIKSASYGLTEAAVTAALQLKFKPAIRNGQPVSQFATIVYEFDKKDAKPQIPSTVF